MGNICRERQVVESIKEHDQLIRIIRFNHDMLLVFSHVENAFMIVFWENSHHKTENNIEILGEGFGWVDENLDLKTLFIRV